MKVNEMTWFQKAVYSAIKEYCINSGSNRLIDCKPIEFIEMHDSCRKPVKGYGGEIITHYEAITRHKEKNHGNNVGVWSVYIGSNGRCEIFLDGTEYRA